MKTWKIGWKILFWIGIGLFMVFVLPLIIRGGIATWRYALQPVVQQSVIQQPVIQQPAVQQPVIQQPAVQQPVIQQPAVQQPAQAIPAMEWTNGGMSRSYPAFDAGTHLEWWMDGYDHGDAGEITLFIGDFSEISYNSVSDGPGYIIEILDVKGESVYTFPKHANSYNDGIWFPVQKGWETIHITYPNPNNESNGCVIFARP
jgi:hypothetical protein